MIRTLAIGLTLFLTPAMTLITSVGWADGTVEGVWDVSTRFKGGSSAGAMRLSLDNDQINGISEPLDGNQFWPLTITGTATETGAKLNLFRKDRAVGQLSVSRVGGRLKGDGVLYGTPVEISAEKSDRETRSPTTHDYAPETYQLQYSSRAEPALRLVPGDRVRTTTLDNEGQDENLTWQGMPGNTLTGPFYIEGAMPGDTLVVHLNKVRLNRDSAKMQSRVINQKAVQSSHPQTPNGEGTLNWKLDGKNNVARVDDPDSALADLELPTKPMIGSIGVAPPLNTAFYAGDLWHHGGNLDYNKMTEGMTLYLPVFRAGAYLLFGDGHALQGDGEISGQGLETSLDVEFTVDLIESENLGCIWSEDADAIMVHGIDQSLDSALQMATTGMAKWLKKPTA